MNIVVGSAFRNFSTRVPKYFAQIQELVKHAGAGHRVRVVAVEGDSTDDTRDAIKREAADRKIDVSLVTCNHGGPVFGSTEAPERMAALTKVGNAILSGVRKSDDVLLYVESDLVWDPHTVGSLIDAAMVKREGFDVFAPMVMAGKAFYDIWAFRKGGVRFGPFAPYHPEWSSSGLTEMDSVGSCLTMRAEVAKTVKMPDGGALVGWCDEAREAGYKIACWADFKVKHP